MTVVNQTITLTGNGTVDASAQKLAWTMINDKRMVVSYVQNNPLGRRFDIIDNQNGLNAATANMVN